MADVPPFSFFSSPSRAGASTLSKELEMAVATVLIQQLNEPDRRENALQQLSKAACLSLPHDKMHKNPNMYSIFSSLSHARLPSLAGNHKKAEAIDESSSYLGTHYKMKPSGWYRRPCLIVKSEETNCLISLESAPHFWKRELFQELAPLLWNSFGTITVLIQEILSIYPALSPPTLTSGASNRVCNALALLQCVASHPDTRSLFLNAQIPLYLFPFLTTTAKTKPFEYLRLTSLGVIGSLVKVDDSEVVSYLLSTEIVPLCLRTMETGSELSKTVATFIIQKVLVDKAGLRYFCSTVEKFYSVGRILVDMVVSLDEQPSTRLLKHVIRCFLRLSDNPRGCFGLKMLLFELFRSGAFNSFHDDPTIRQWLQQLLQNITVGTAETLLQPRIFYPVLGN